MFNLAYLPPNKEIETSLVLKQLAKSHRHLAELKGIAKTIPNEQILINTLTLQEAKSSSEIENIVTTHDDLYKENIFIETKNPASKEVVNYNRSLKRGFEIVRNENLLLNKHIIEIQQILEQNNAGFRKQAGTKLVNSFGDTIYTPPQDSDEVIKLMSNLEKFINDDGFSDYDPLVKMAIIYYQFESIHPFYDGNGRTGRIINVLYLVLKKLLDLPILYLSRYIIQTKSEYYNVLQQVRDKNDWENMILYLLKGIEITSVQTIDLVNRIKFLMNEYKQKLRTELPKKYSQDLLNNLFKNPYTKKEFLAKDLSMTQRTAQNYLDEVSKIGLLEKIKVGNSNYYINIDLIKVLMGEKLLEKISDFFPRKLNFKTKKMKITILGGGESGFGAAYLAKKKGFEVFLSDKGILKEDYKNLLITSEIEFEEGSHDEERILDSDCIVKSPGIPEKVEILQKARAKGIEIISEIEFGYRFTDAKIIAITGSNGKTTTTSLVYHILKNAGLNVGLGGNIGTSFAKQVADENFDYYVLEISSFQLDDIKGFKPYISFLLNLSPDHLDQYNYEYEKYALAKFRIAENQDENDFFVFNNDDEMSRKLIENMNIKAKKIRFSTQKKMENGAFISGENITFQDFSMPIKNLSLVGTHNVANCLSAVVVAKTLGISNESLTQYLGNFEAVEHRLEFVAEIDGVKFINDSKATNVNATFYALGSMVQPTIWIVGGVDKGNDYTEIQQLVKEKVKTIIAMGTDNSKILDFFGGQKIYDTKSMEEAVDLAKKLAQKGDAVLLSPCCASFDLFKNYEDRGQQFKQQVLK